MNIESLSRSSTTTRRVVILFRNLKSGTDYIGEDVRQIPKVVRELLTKKNLVTVAVASDPHIVMYAYRSIHRLSNIITLIAKREWAVDDKITTFRNRPVFASGKWNDYLRFFLQHYMSMHYGGSLAALIRRYDPKPGHVNFEFVVELGMTIAWFHFGSEEHVPAGAASIAKELLVPHYSLDSLQYRGTMAKERAHRMLACGWRPPISEARDIKLVKKFIQLCIPG